MLNINHKGLAEIAEVLVDELKKYNDELVNDELQALAQPIIKSNVLLIMRLQSETDIEKRNRKVRNLVNNYMKLNSVKE